MNDFTRISTTRGLVRKNISNDKFEASLSVRTVKLTVSPIALSIALRHALIHQRRDLR